MVWNGAEDVKGTKNDHGNDWIHGRVIPRRHGMSREKGRQMPRMHGPTEQLAEVTRLGEDSRLPCYSDQLVMTHRPALFGE